MTRTSRMTAGGQGEVAVQPAATPDVDPRDATTFRFRNVRTLGTFTSFDRPSEPSPPSSAPRVATGVPRLDQLLGGGLPRGSATLVYGPTYTGKSALPRLFFLEGLRSGAPGAFVLTDEDAAELSLRLSLSEPRLAEFEAQGLATYVDAYSRMVGGGEDHPAAVYISDLQNTDALFRTLDSLQQRFAQEQRRDYRLLIQSASTLLAEAGAIQVFRHLRVLLGRLKRTGGTALIVLEEGMHTEAEVETIKHLCTGMIHTRKMDDKFFFGVEGLQTVYQPGWVEYEATPQDFLITGSFSSERIRSMANMG